MTTIITEMELQNARRSLKKVASCEGVPLQIVMENVTDAIQQARLNPDPQVRAMWSASPFSDRCPSPEEFVAWCAKLAENMD